MAIQLILATLLLYINTSKYYYKKGTVGSNPVAFGLVYYPQLLEKRIFIFLWAPLFECPSTSMTYALYYHNLGNINAHNVILEDQLSDGLTFENASDGGVYNPSTRKVTWNIGSLAPSDGGYRYIAVKTPYDVVEGTMIPNNASISTPDPESRYDDNNAEAQTTIIKNPLPPNVRY